MKLGVFFITYFVNSIFDFWEGNVEAVREEVAARPVEVLFHSEIRWNV